MKYYALIHGPVNTFLASANNSILTEWQPSASLETLHQRAQLLAALRTYFAGQGIMEVETPLLSVAATTDPMIESLIVPAADGIRFLHTSPEFAMKRLLAAGSGDIYQICRVFRAGEQGRHHNPEFTLVEWYRLGWDDRRLADEVIQLIASTAQSLGVKEQIDIQYKTYADVFQERFGLDPHLASQESLLDSAASEGLRLQGALSRDGCLDLLMGLVIAPAFAPDQLTVITDYPVTQAALARVRKGDPPVAARFEVFAGGLELANGFHELTDAAEQQRRFEEDEQVRISTGRSARPCDRRLLRALESGLPDCAGVALGLDRLLLWLTGGTRLSEVTAFTWERA